MNIFLKEIEVDQLFVIYAGDDEELSYSEFVAAFARRACTAAIQPAGRAEKFTKLQGGVGIVAQSNILVAESKLTDHIFEKWHGLQEAFLASDMDRSGTIDRDEFVNLLTRFGLGISEEDMQALMDKFDTDGSGDVSFAVRGSHAPAKFAPAPIHPHAWSSSFAQLLASSLVDMFAPLRRNLPIELSSNSMKPSQTRSLTSGLLLRRRSGGVGHCLLRVIHPVR